MTGFYLGTFSTNELFLLGIFNIIQSYKCIHFLRNDVDFVGNVSFESNHAVTFGV